MIIHRRLALTFASIVVAEVISLGPMARPAAAQTLPWMEVSLSREERTELLLGAMTLDQKIQQMGNSPSANEELTGCEFTRLGRHVEGIPELAIPTLRAINGGTGMRGGDCLPESTATGLPSATLGAVTEADIDELLRGRYLQMFGFGHFDSPYDMFLPTDYSIHAEVAKKAAEEGVVLLRNRRHFLPLEPSIRSVALIGAEWFAGMATLPPRNGNPLELTTVISPPSLTISPQQGLQNTIAKLGSLATVTYNNGSDIATAVALAEASDVVVVMVGDTPRETRDRIDLRLPVVPSTASPPAPCDAHEDPEELICEPPASAAATTDQEALVAAIAAAAGNKTVVVLKTSGMVLMPWLPDVRALLEAWFPGQHDGDVVADILFGVISPSGKLPVTFGRSAREAAYATTARYPGMRENNGLPGGPGFGGTPGAAQLVGHYSEGLRMGYRWYEANNVKPLFPFGFGLSYTTFAYSDLSVDTQVDRRTGHAVLTATYTITNTGNRQGAETSQVYLTLPPTAQEPSKRLVGFEKLDLMPGESRSVTVIVDSAAPNHPLSYFQPDPNGSWADGYWRIKRGSYTLHVGTSSTNTPLQATVRLPRVLPPIQLRLVRRALNLSRPGLATAELSVPAPYSLADLNIANVRLEGASALSTALSPDGSVMVATFDRARLTQLETGENVVVALSADIVRNGIPDRLWVSTTARVRR